MPLASSRIWWNSAFGTVGTNETPSTSSRASTSAQPDFDIVVGSRIFLRLVCGVWAIRVSLCVRELSLRAERSNLGPTGLRRDCFVAPLLAMTRMGQRLD